MEKKIDHIIARILSREETFDDVLKLEEWMNSDERNKEEFCKIRNYWDAEVSVDETLPAKYVIDKIQRKIEAEEKHRKRMLVMKTRIPLLVASVVLLLGVFSFFIYQQSEESPKEIYTYLTGDSRTRFSLIDGTKITLNKNSKLIYTNDYGTSNRKVKLEGEGFFEVTNDPANPFEIAIELNHTDVSIKVLGTVFSVRIDADNERVTASLVEGSIVFQTIDQRVKMLPDQKLIYTYHNHNIDIQTANIEEEIAWKDGLIKYKAVTFSQLMSELEKRFNTQILIKSVRLTSPDVVVTGTFTEEQTLHQILKVISESIPIKWTEKDGIYTIK